MNKQYVEEKIRERLKLEEEDSIIFKQVTKNNGCVMDACIINKKGEMISPNIYYDADDDDDVIAKHICVVYVSNRKQTEEMNEARDEITKVYCDKDLFLSKVKPMLICRERNEELLAELPHIEYLNMEIIYYIDLSVGTAKVQNALLDRFKITISDLHEHAMRNLYADYKVEKLFEIVKNANPEVPEDFDFDGYVISNSNRIYGAAQVLNSKALSEVAKKIGKEFYIIPSSVHEMICIPKTEDDDEDTLIEMIKMTNATEVSEKDFLSNSLYRYNDGIVEEVA